jgi:AICAR transformylase/IMP cyclohydrolase PurH
MIRFLFIISLIFSLHSCGTLITSLITPSTLATSVADYKIEQETGKKVSEHILSYVTKKDCKFTLEIQNICKENAILIVENNRTRDLVKNALKKQD